MASFRVFVLAALGLATTVIAPGNGWAASRAVVSSVTGHPERVGQCFSTHVRSVGNRLGDQAHGDVAGSGSKIIFADGHENVDYLQDPAIDRSKPGDPVRLCVTKLPPKTCPAGDTRNIVYRGRNLRTGLTWESSDSTHACDGV